MAKVKWQIKWDADKRLNAVILSEAKNLGSCSFNELRHGDPSSPVGGRTLLKVCHSERSEESALVRFGPELQILRFAQDDRYFHRLGWVGGP